MLLSDSSSDDEDEDPIRREDLQETLKLHKYMRQTRVEFYQDPQHGQYQYYSTGLLSNYDKFAEHQKMIVGPRKKVPKDQKKHDKKMKGKECVICSCCCILCVNSSSGPYIKVSSLFFQQVNEKQLFFFWGGWGGVIVVFTYKVLHSSQNTRNSYHDHDHCDIDFTRFL